MHVMIHRSAAAGEVMHFFVYSWGSGNSLLEELDIRGH